MEDGQEWMAIKPNEIETMRQPIARAAGQVVAFGLGMGYYAFMVSEKPEVKTLTIVERDENVIALFREHILPQFPKRRRSISFGKMLLSLRRIACPTAITTMLLWIYGTMYPTDILFTSK